MFLQEPDLGGGVFLPLHRASVLEIVFLTLLMLLLHLSLSRVVAMGFVGCEGDFFLI